MCPGRIGRVPLAAPAPIMTGTGYTAWILIVAGALGACSARSSKTPAVPPAGGNPAPPPAVPPVEPPRPLRPVPPPRGLPEAPEDVCIPTHASGCVPAPEFNRMATKKAPDYTAHSGFKAQWGLESINAHVAYAHVNLLKGPDAAPGAGVVIGVIDSGIDTEHPAFKGKTIHEEFLPGTTRETGEEFSHGTAVASVAAGMRISDPDAAHGVAWGADLAVWATPPKELTAEPVTLEELAGDDDWIASIFRPALTWSSGGRSVDILNLSFGYNGVIDAYSEEDLRANLPKTIAALAQADAPDKTILVWAAGNGHGGGIDADEANTAGIAGRRMAGKEHREGDAVSAVILAGLAARIEELRGHTVAVVALSPDGGGITHFSNRCGIAADFCIAAPGETVRVASFGPAPGEPNGVRGHGDEEGTSFAAPMVAGGLAVMKHLFRDQLTSEELVTRLFATADDTGIYADRSIYGNGRMDLGAATSPVGVLGVPIETTGALATGQAALQSTRLRLGAAFGDGIQGALDDHEIMSLDSLGAPFWHRLDGFAVTTDGPSMAARLRSFLGPDSGSAFPGRGNLQPGVTGVHGDILRMPTATGSGHLALAEGAVMFSAVGHGGLSATAFTTGDWRAGMPAAGAAFDWRPGNLPVGIRAGWIEERETLLGSMGHGAFGNLSATTGFLGIDGGVQLGRWRLGGSGEFGMARPEVHGGIIQDISTLATTAFSVHLGTTLADAGSLEFSVSQPLRVEAGQAALQVPAARTRQRTVTYHGFTADLAPGNRWIDLTAQWNRRLGPGEFRLGAIRSHRAGHRKALGAPMALLSGWRWTF